MSNISSYNNHTIALDSKGKVLFCAEINFVAAQDFVTIARDAETIITGNNLSASVTGFIGHENVRNIYILNENLYSSVNTFYNSRGYVNESGESVTVTKINSIEELDFNEITFGSDKYFIKDNVCPFDIFEVKGDGVTDDTVAINFAIACVINMGGELLFKGDATYAISSPLKICSPNNQSVSKDFIIDFNNSRITVVNESTFNTPNSENLPDSMIYVNVNFADENKTGAVRNVQLYPGIYQDDNTYKPCVDTGLYLAYSSQIDYKNIKILDVNRGVYIPVETDDKYNGDISMDNIQISKTRSGKTSLLDFPVSNVNVLPPTIVNEIANNYSTTKKVGIDCRADSCNFSNIVVIDYLVGMRVIGAQNKVYGAHIWNTYCPEQYKYSVGFINGGKSDSPIVPKKNVYTACVADKIHIGWLSSDIEDFELINCHWYNKEVKINGVVYENEAYGFYIPDDVAENYLLDKPVGGNITAIDCYMVGSNLDNDECFTNFCNIKNHSINYTGATENTFYAPIPGMQKFMDSENNIHDVENNVAFNQYGRIKTTEVVIAENMDRLDLFELTPNDISNSPYYIDNIKRAKETDSAQDEFGIIFKYNVDTEVTTNDSDVAITISVPENDTFGWNGLRVPLKSLGYKVGDVGFISFDYKTEYEGENTQAKHVLFSSASHFNEYFSNKVVYSEKLEENANEDDNWKSYHHWFKLCDGFNANDYILIGYGGLSTEATDNPIVKSVNPIEIKNLRIIKNPNNFTVPNVPKYYLETEENYNKRLLRRFTYENSKITYNNETGLASIKSREYNQSHPAYKRYGDASKLSCISLPLKHYVYAQTANENQYVPSYSLSYTGLGRPSFSGNIVKRGNVPYGKTLTRPFISLVYDVEPSNIYLTASCKYPSYAVFTKEDELNTQVDGEHFKEEQAIIGVHNTKNDDFVAIKYDSYLRNLVINEGATIWNTITLPVYQVGNPYLPKLYDDTVEEPYIITNLINNPFGYYFETPIDVGDSSVETPLYTNGEIRLVMKNAEYSTNLPTVFYEVEYFDTQENNSSEV